MKRHLLLILILPLFIILTGCTKQPATVYKYSQEMEKTVNKYTTLGVFAHYKDSKRTMFLSYWEKDGKTMENVFSPQDAKSKTQICKKNECIYYWQDNQYADKIDIYNHPSYDGHDIKSINQIYPVLYWGKFYNIGNKTKGKFTSNNYEINGYACRLMKIEDEFELCINDEYGIAIYIKSDGKYPYEYNVKEIFTDNIYDSNFDLPPGMIKR